MFKFFCAVCIEDKDLYASAIDSNYAYANCPGCDSLLKEVFSRHDGITDEEMTTESYKALNGLDNSTP